MHQVTLPPDCGFVVGWAPGMFDLQRDGESVEQARNRVAVETFRSTFKRQPIIFDRYSDPSLY
jgi:hypothetical protein